MAARKLQTEIDRTLKKVSEGVELFESIYDKMQACTNQTQKEKLETDLKTQIKKLQRLRDQIKTWVASNDIKDKTQLLENRRLIETQMEKFKACEKEMKTKAFSKGGLLQSAKLDPKAQEKMQTTAWLQDCVENLLLQVEASEAEIETLQAGGRKKNKAGSERAEELDQLNTRRKWHISRLEIMLRLLDNGTINSEQALELKEDINYYVEDNAADDYNEDEGMYDELNLDEEEEKFGLVADERDSDESEDESEDLPPRTPSKKHDEESVSSSKRDDSPILKKAGVTLQLRKHSTATEAPKPPPNPNFAQQPMASILKAGLPSSSSQPSTTRAPPPQLPPIRYAAAAAAAVTPSTSAQSVTTNATSTTTHSSPQNITSPHETSEDKATSSLSSPQANRTLSQDTYNAVLSSPSLTHPSTNSPLLSSTSAQMPDGSTSFDSPVMSEAAESNVVGSGSVSASAAGEATSSPQVTQSPHASQILADGHAQAPQPHTNGTSTTTSTTPATAAQAVPSPMPHQVQPSSYPIGGPPGVPPPSAVNATATSNTSSPLPSAQQPTQAQPQQGTVPQFPPGVKVAAGSEAQAQTQQSQPQPQQPMAQPAQQLPPGVLAAAAGHRPPSAVPTPGMTPDRIPPRSSSTAFPAGLSDLVASFESVKQKAPHRMTNLDQVHKLLEGGYSGLPQPQDTAKPKYYVPRNPYQTPSYYPQSPNPVLSSAGLFSQLDVETLFYVFYFLPGTYQQYLAAKELKRQSWRFHVKYLTWFQRHSEPQAITEEYEQGVYVYFDWEGSWCQRKKSDFRFEYRYLSED